LRIAVAGQRFDPESAPEGLKRSLARAARVESFAEVEPLLRATEASVREDFEAIVGTAAGS
jgi:hypothetical protein